MEIYGKGATLTDFRGTHGMLNGWPLDESTNADGVEGVGPRSTARPIVEATQPAEMRRHRYWEPSRRLLDSIRDYAKAREAGGAIGAVQSKAAVLRHRFWSIVTGAEIPLNIAKLGEGLELPHPNGVVIHHGVQVGPDCRLFQQVTIGTGPRPGLPRLGARVWVGAGAKILGGVCIGDDAIIGANAVVLADVPADSVAVGIPAVVKPRARRQWDLAESKRGSQLSTMVPFQQKPHT